MTGGADRVSVARTMAEKGELCPRCEHPWGRHLPGGCVATDVEGAVCGCQSLPVRRTRRPPHHTPA